MIIEIKDLPKGRKVQRILVDITFEDTSTHVTSEPSEHNTVDELENTQDTISKPVMDTTKIVPDDSNVLETSQMAPQMAPHVAGSVNLDRPEREIPKEMLNIEF